MIGWLCVFVATSTAVSTRPWHPAGPPSDAIVFSRDPDPFAPKLSRDDWPLTIVWENGKTQAKLRGPYEPRQWVPMLGKLLCGRDHRIFSWTPGNGPPELMCDVLKVVPDFPKLTSALAFSVAPDLRTVAVYPVYADVEPRLWILRMDTQKVVCSLGNKAFKSAGVPGLDCLQYLYGVAWSPDGKRVAVGVRGPADKEASDGGGPTECVVASLDGTCKFLGRGVPVAWIDSEHVLCGRQFVDRNFDDLAPEIISLSGSRKVGRVHGMLVGYDGRNVLVARGKTLSVLSTGLKRIATARIPDLKFRRAYFDSATLVTVPGDTARR